MRGKTVGLAGLTAVAVVVSSGFGARTREVSNPTGQYIPIVVTTTTDGGTTGTTGNGPPVVGGPPPGVPPVTKPIKKCLDEESSHHPGPASRKTRMKAYEYWLPLYQDEEFTVKWTNDANSPIYFVNWKAYLVQGDTCKELAHNNNGYIDLTDPFQGNNQQQSCKVRLLKQLANGEQIFLTALVDNSFDEFEENGIYLHSK